MNSPTSVLEFNLRGSNPHVPASHFIFIPSVLLVGLVIGWILGSRAARDAYLAEIKKREDREARNRAKT